MSGEQSTVLHRALLLGGTCAAGTATVYTAAARTAGGQRFEDSVLRSADLLAGADTHTAARAVLATVSVPVIAVGIVLVMLTGMLRRRTALGLLAAGTVVVSAVTTEVCQRVLERPVLLSDGDRREDQSFPSGHMTVAMSLAFAIALVVPHRRRNAAVALAVIVAAGVGVATVTAGWHRPSDTVGAALIVIGYLCGAVAVLARSGRLQATPLWRRHRMWPYVMVAAAGGVGCAALTASSRGDPGVALLVAGCLVTLGGTAVVAAATLALLRQVDLGTTPTSRADEGSHDDAPGLHRPAGP